MADQKNSMPLTGEEKAIVDDIVAIIRSKLEQGGDFPPSILLGTRDQKELEILPIDTKSNLAKELSTQLARVVAEKMQADFAIVVIEAWMVKAEMKKGSSTKDVKEFQKRLNDQYPSLADHPDRIEVVHISVETRTGMWAGSAEIKFKYPSKKKRTFGNIEFEMNSQLGRFVGILPQQKTVLH